MRKIATMGALALAAIVRTAQAHPGHGEGGGSFGFTHYLSEPVHIGIGVLIVLAVASVLMAARKAARSRFPL